MSNQEILLKAILHTVARQTFGVGEILKLVAVGASKEKLIQAYNFCDGTRSQSEAAKDAGLDSGNFSRTIARWIDEGIVIRVGDGRDLKLLHVYPLPRDVLKRAEKADG